MTERCPSDDAADRRAQKAARRPKGFIIGLLIGMIAGAAILAVIWGLQLVEITWRY